jgi:hypothetical protein
MPSDTGRVRDSQWLFAGSIGVGVGVALAVAGWACSRDESEENETGNKVLYGLAGGFGALGVAMLIVYAIGSKRDPAPTPVQLTLSAAPNGMGLGGRYSF